MDDATLAALRIVASAAIDIAFATLVGAFATAAMLLDARSPWAAAHARRAWRLAASASVVALVASLAWIWIEAISMTELAPVAALMAVPGVVEGTQFGRAWAAGGWALLACVAWAIAAARRATPSRPLFVATALTLAVFAIAHAGAGHAAAQGPGVQVLVMGVHLLAIGAWAGAVITATLAALPGSPDAADALRYARRLSALATGALALVIVTGALAAWHGLGGSLAPLAPSSGSTWGLVLDAKLAAVALAIALGGFNRLVTLPALRSAAALEAPWRRFMQVLRVEAVVMLGVLVAAALLGNGEPPAT